MFLISMGCVRCFLQFSVHTHELFRAYQRLILSKTRSNVGKEQIVFGYFRRNKMTKKVIFDYDYQKPTN